MAALREFWKHAVEGEDPHFKLTWELKGSNLAFSLLNCPLTATPV